MGLVMLGIGWSGNWLRWRDRLETTRRFLWGPFLAFIPVSSRSSPPGTRPRSAVSPGWPMAGCAPPTRILKNFGLVGGFLFIATDAKMEPLGRAFTVEPRPQS